MQNWASERHVAYCSNTLEWWLWTDGNFVHPAYICTEITVAVAAIWQERAVTVFPSTVRPCLNIALSVYRIQQIQLLGRGMKGPEHEKLWNQLEAEIHLHRHKTVVRACRGRVSHHCQLPAPQEHVSETLCQWRSQHILAILYFLSFLCKIWFNPYRHLFFLCSDVEWITGNWKLQYDFLADVGILCNWIAHCTLLRWYCFCGDGITVSFSCLVSIRIPAVDRIISHCIVVRALVMCGKYSYRKKLTRVWAYQ